MKAFNLVILFVLFNNFCAAQKNQNFITLVGESPPDDHIFVNYLDEFLDNHNYMFMRDSLTGNLKHVVIPTKHNLLLKFNKNMQQYPVLAQPGDTVYIKSNPISSVKFTFHGKREHELNFFTYLEQHGCGIGYPDFFGMDPRTTDFPSKSKRFLQLYNQRLSLLERAKDSLNFNPEFYAYAKNEIEGQYLHALLAPYWDPDHKYNQFSPNYKNTIIDSGVKNYLTHDAFVAPSFMYRPVAVSYIRLLSRHVLDTPDEVAVMYQNAKKELQGKTRDYVQFYLLKMNIDKGLPDFKKDQEDFRKICSYAPYIKYIDSLAARFEKLLFSPTLLKASLESSTGKQISWNEILDKNKGKAVYIDLWASWCGPCIAEMPESKKLQKSLAGKDVSFVYISLDHNREKWKNSMEKIGLDVEGFQNYLLHPSSELARFLNAPPIPRYVLIDKQGRAVALDAKRPSDPNLLNDIYKLF